LFNYGIRPKSTNLVKRNWKRKNVPENGKKAKAAKKK
jgi:hypothetical protein